MPYSHKFPFHLHTSAWYVDANQLACVSTSACVRGWLQAECNWTCCCKMFGTRHVDSGHEIAGFQLKNMASACAPYGSVGGVPIAAEF